MPDLGILGTIVPPRIIAVLKSDAQKMRRLYMSNYAPLKHELHLDVLFL